MTAIIVYRNQLLPISETFVYNQTFRLKRYSAFLLGAKWHLGPSIKLPLNRCQVINQGGVAGISREIQWKLYGRIPSDINEWMIGHRPVLIHAHFGSDGAVALPLAQALRIPFLISYHGTDATMKFSYAWYKSSIPHRLYTMRRGKLAQFASRLIVQSNYLAKIISEQHNMPSEKIYCIRHGIDVERFSLNRASLNRAAVEHGHILYVGRLIERKGLGYLIKALSCIQDEYPQLKLTVIGDGEMRSDYEKMAFGMLKIPFEFIGAQPHEIVREYFEKAYLFCMPSITMPSGEAETLGMVFLEAMAMKVPPVSFRSGGIPEVILHGKTGFLAEEKNVGELAFYIKQLLDNPDLRHTMGESGRKHVELEFNLDKQNAKLEALYDEVIAEHSKKYGDLI
ncbi:MAG: glycosyltransferase [Bacteroidetes bacterium]|nr:MAG: glycosyltransferase [Bacteroidota bacterium]